MKVKSLIPMLETKNLMQTIEFYKQNLGFRCEAVYPSEENICWASLWNGEYEIAFCLPNAHTNFEKPVLTGSIYMHVENIEELWQKLKDKVEIVCPPENMNYGMREFGIRDCNGYVLNLGQDISEK
jgi:uncharacterized glyoxalase superfamily protein PhnB